jgi:hypothetical protein
MRNSFTTFYKIFLDRNKSIFFRRGIHTKSILEFSLCFYQTLSFRGLRIWSLLKKNFFLFFLFFGKRYSFKRHNLQRSLILYTYMTVHHFQRNRLQNKVQYGMLTVFPSVLKIGILWVSDLHGNFSQTSVTEPHHFIQLRKNNCSGFNSSCSLPVYT